MSKNKKRHLSESEINTLRRFMESAPQERKPSVRFFAKMFGVNQPSIIKSLGGWEGIQRNRPQVLPKPKIIQSGGSPVKFEEATTRVEIARENINA